MMSVLFEDAQIILIDKLKAESLYIAYKSIKLVFKAFLY